MTSFQLISFLCHRNGRCSNVNFFVESSQWGSYVVFSIICLFTYLFIHYLNLLIRVWYLSELCAVTAQTAAQSHQSLLFAHTILIGTQVKTRAQNIGLKLH